MKSINLLSGEGQIGLKTALLLLLASNPSLSQIDEYFDYLKNMIKYNCQIGVSDIWNTLGLTKEETLEYFNAVLNENIDNWAKDHGCFVGECDWGTLIRWSESTPTIPGQASHLSISNRGGCVSLIKGAGALPT